MDRPWKSTDVYNLPLALSLNSPELLQPLHVPKLSGEFLKVVVVCLQDLHVVTRTYAFLREDVRAKR